jgi:hypothetical protein
LLIVAFDRIHPPALLPVERLADALCDPPLPCITHPVTVTRCAASADRLDVVVCDDVFVPAPRRDVSV